MVDAKYLRLQAAKCLEWSRKCFDLGTARQLRLMAEEFLQKAEQLEARDTSQKTADLNDTITDAHRDTQIRDGGDAP